jgi:hypothetical protein
VADAYYVSSFGGLRLWASKFSTDKSRTQVRHDLSSGDDFVVQDRGRALLVTNVSLVFDWMDGDDLSPLDRLRKLLALVDAQARILSHPIEGSFLARVGPFKYEIDQSGVISAEVEFAAVSAVTSTAPVSAGTLSGPGIGLCSAAADDLQAQLDDVGLTSSSPTTVVATVAGWSSSDNPNPRQILAQTGSLTSQLGAEAGIYDHDLNLWSAFKATVVLAETVRIAAGSAAADTASTFLLRVGTPIALRALLTANYPADEADSRYDEIMQLNDIVSPWSIDIGTELQMPLPTPTARGA